MQYLLAGYLLGGMGLVGQRFARDRDRAAVHVAGVDQAAGDHADATRAVHLDGRILAAGHQVGDQGRGLADSVEVGQIQFDAGFVGERQQMQHGVGGAAVAATQAMAF
jgi:hypothetical protein